MGTYTRFVFKASLRSDTPVEVIKFLTDIFDFSKKKVFHDSEVVVPTIDHPLFECERWDHLFYLHSDGDRPCFKKTGKLWRLQLDAEFKNYGGEIYKFIDWITPYIHTGRKVKKYLGYCLREGYGEGRQPEYFYKRQEVLK